MTATKWWIGGAAQTATHAVVFAQMIINGKRWGVKNFVVQLRDASNFKPEQGINIGDIGAKMGRHGIDNGWIQFTHVRVPRSHMLMRYTKVNRQGVVSEPPLAQLAYGALIQGRVSMIAGRITNHAEIIKRFGNVCKKGIGHCNSICFCETTIWSKEGSTRNKDSRLHYSPTSSYATSS